MHIQIMISLIGGSRGIGYLSWGDGEVVACCCPSPVSDLRGLSVEISRYLLLFTGVFAAAHDLKMEWVVIKGISDYANGTASLTEHWKPFASVMAASVVNNILREPVVFEQWPHYQNNSCVRGSQTDQGGSLAIAKELQSSTTSFDAGLFHQKSSSQLCTLSNSKDKRVFNAI